MSSIPGAAIARTPRDFDSPLNAEVGFPRRRSYAFTQ
jgi:hypothetical protein